MIRHPGYYATNWLTIILNINSNTKNLDLSKLITDTAKSTYGWNSFGKKIRALVTIGNGTVVYSTDPNTPALYVNSGELRSYDMIFLTNKGIIAGAGGVAGAAGNPDGGSGGKGGDALQVNRTLYLDNLNGIIRSGGGGGGGGAGYTYKTRETSYAIKGSDSTDACKGQGCDNLWNRPCYYLTCRTKCFNDCNNECTNAIARCNPGSNNCTGGSSSVTANGSPCNDFAVLRENEVECVVNTREFKKKNKTIGTCITYFTVSNCKTIYIECTPFSGGTGGRGKGFLEGGVNFTDVNGLAGSGTNGANGGDWGQPGQNAADYVLPASNEDIAYANPGTGGSGGAPGYSITGNNNIVYLNQGTLVGSFI
jgi:hypothetical protein